MNNIPPHSSKPNLWIPTHPEFYTWDALKHLFLNQERLWGAQLQVPSAAHPGSCSTGQAKAAQHPGILPDTTHKLPLVGKYNGREPGRGKNTLAIISHPEIESWCNWNTYVDLGSYLDPTALDESRHNLSPHSSTSPLNLHCSFGDCPKESPKSET